MYRSRQPSEPGAPPRRGPRERLAPRLIVLALAVVAVLVAPPSAAQEPEAGESESPPWWRPREAVLAATTAHFDVFVPRGSPLEALAAGVAATAEAVLPTVEARMETRLADRVRVSLIPAEQAPQPCEPRGAAIPSRRRVVLFAGPATLEPRAMAAFLAHELGHQLTLDRWGALGDDRRLSEGVATWAAEPYWLVWRGWPSLAAGVRDLHAADAFGPLAETREGCYLTAERDVYYSAWASFVGFLGDRYGWDAFGAALQHPPVADDLADYVAAFGRPLPDLLAEWERALAAGAMP